MEAQKRLLFIGAHPDDETFGLGGTLAKYAAGGVKVYYACTTRGEAGIIPPGAMQGHASAGDMRWNELMCAAEILGLAGVIHLGYRDSGMSGSADNGHTEALVNAPLQEVTERMVKVIREIKPQVVITFDPIGGYRHPDHIVTHQAALAAFHAAADPSLFPSSGSTYAPQKLYYVVMKKKLMRLMLRLMPLFGQDPHRMGQNRDVDLGGIAAVEYPVHAAIKLNRQAIETRKKAIACHFSQIGGKRRLSLRSVIEIFGRHSEFYMRAYPEVKGKCNEKDLFEGVQF